MVSQTGKATTLVGVAVLLVGCPSFDRGDYSVRTDQTDASTRQGGSGSGGTPLDAGGTQGASGSHAGGTGFDSGGAFPGPGGRSSAGDAGGVTTGGSSAAAGAGGTIATGGAAGTGGRVTSCNAAACPPCTAQIYVPCCQGNGECGCALPFAPCFSATQSDAGSSEK